MRRSGRLSVLAVLTLLAISLEGCSGMSVHLMERATTVAEEIVDRYKEQPRRDVRLMDYRKLKRLDRIQMIDVKCVRSLAPLHTACRLPGLCP